MEKEFLDVLYQNAQMGIVGIEDVIYKVNNKYLYKEMKRVKKEYNLIIKELNKYYKINNMEPKKISIIAKVSSEIVSEIKLMKEENDKVICKMMIEGSYKSMGILTTKILEYRDINSKIIEIANKLINIVEGSINNLKKIDKVIE